MSTPTEALRSVLDRDLSKARAKNVIELACPLLQELVNHGTCALARCIRLSPRSADSRYSCHVLYRHIIEATDGIEVLISQGCGAPAVPTLRSSFEALLSLRYILTDDARYALRSDAWVVGYMRQRLEFWELINPETRKGKEFYAVLESGTTSRFPAPTSAEEARAGSTNIKEVLAKPEYQKIQDEFNQQKNPRPQWYSLYGGPQNLRELAKHLGLLPQYEILYRQWSRIAHAQDPLHFFAPPLKDQPFLGALREPKDLPFTAYLAAMMLIGATTAVSGSVFTGRPIIDAYKRSRRLEMAAIIVGQSVLNDYSKSQEWFLKDQSHRPGPSGVKGDAEVEFFGAFDAALVRYPIPQKDIHLREKGAFLVPTIVWKSIDNGHYDCKEAVLEAFWKHRKTIEGTAWQKAENTERFFRYCRSRIRRWQNGDRARF